MCSSQVFKGSGSALHSGHLGWLWVQLPRPRLMCSYQTHTLKSPGSLSLPAAAGHWVAQARLCLAVVGEGAWDPPLSGLCYNWKFMFNWRVTCFMWDQRESSPQVCDGDKRYISTCLHGEGRKLHVEFIERFLGRERKHSAAPVDKGIHTPSISMQRFLPSWLMFF